MFLTIENQRKLMLDLHTYEAMKQILSFQMAVDLDRALIHAILDAY